MSSSYLQTYGVEDERRGRVVKRFVIAGVAAVLLAATGYLVFHNFPERQKAKHFLAEVNDQQYKLAYADWGCSEKTPCPNYDFRRFMEDWQVKSDGWHVTSSDSCTTFLTVNVQEPGSELQSIAVQRSDHSLGFAPASECQERKWHWKQFLARLTGRESAPQPPAPGQ